MTFLRFLAWTFYWLRLEFAALQEPARAFIIARSRGRWRVYYGETGRALDELELVPVQGEGREAWLAIRHALEGIDPREPLEFTTEALAAAADKLEAAQEKEREAELRDLRNERERRRGALAAAERERERLAEELEQLDEQRRLEAAVPKRPKSGPELALEAEAEAARALEQSSAAQAFREGAGDDDHGETLGDEDAMLDLEAQPTLLEEPEPQRERRKGF